MKRYVAYYRVSTARQGISGLGLEAQQAAVEAFIGSGGELIESFKEIESGKKNERPQLAAAIDYAKRQGARLVIAKLDRLSRNASFIFKLRDSKVDFVCCDIPDANTLHIGIFAVMAQHERETISARTIAALNAKRARGEALGNPANLTDEHRAMGTQKVQENARNATANIQAAGIIADKKALSWTLQAIADHLNAQKYKTRRGCAFTANSVLVLLNRQGVASDASEVTSRIQVASKIK